MAELSIAPDARNGQCSVELEPRTGSDRRNSVI